MKNLLLVLALVFVTIEQGEAHTSKQFLTVSKCNGCTVSESDRVSAAVIKVNETIAGACFRKEMVSMSLIQTEGRTPEQVVDHLASSQIQVETQKYWTIRRVLGYTLPNVNKIWLNSRYMMKWNVCDTASLLAHESSHKVGYSHDYKPTSRRPMSVPYSLNRAFEACCTK